MAYRRRRGLVAISLAARGETPAALNAAMHPGWLRCSRLTYGRNARPSRLASSCPGNRGFCGNGPAGGAVERVHTYGKRSDRPLATRFRRAEALCDSHWNRTVRRPRHTNPSNASIRDNYQIKSRTAPAAGVRMAAGEPASSSCGRTPPGARRPGNVPSRASCSGPGRSTASDRKCRLPGLPESA